MSAPTAGRVDWGHVLVQAAVVVASYGTPVTLRQLHYQLVSRGLIPNTQSAYKRLSALTAEARRGGTFPDLSDRTRSIVRPTSFASPDDARDWLADIYRRDRTEGQEWSVYLGVEKHGLVAQLEDWFDELGVPILALGGYSSQTFVDEVVRDVGRNWRRSPLPEDRLPALKAAVDEERLSTRAALSLLAGDPRPAVLLYAGDFDPSGEDIDRDFVERADCFDKVIRVALTPEQVDEHNLPPAMGKAADSRASRFVARHGRLVQVELDALAPDVLRGLYREAIDAFWDMSSYNEVLAAERAEREELAS